MKGLNQFIADIRNCPNKEAETKRVEKEMAKIRQKFTSNKALEGYQKKKYVWKLLYMLTLGYDIDFGQNEAATLITAAKFSEKYTGYVATSVMITEKNSEIYQRISQSIRNDLLSNNEIYQCLALASIGTIAPKDLVEVVVGDIIKMALFDQGRTPMFVRKKAILVLLRIFRKFKDKFTIDEGWSKAIYSMLDQKNLGFLCSAVGFLTGVVSLTSYSGFEENVPKLIRILYKLVINKDCSSDYLYYHTPNPWLQVKILKALQLFPPPTESKELSAVNEILTKIMTKTEVTKSVNKNNADHGILFEAVNLIIHYRNFINSDLRNQTTSLLGVFISVREPNIRYLALEAMSKFANSPNAENLIQEHLKTILSSLRDNDISIRRRALDILYIMCTPATAPKIVEELLNYSDEHDLQLKEELVLKIAILAEKFADNLIWYIDVVVRLVSNAGDYITEDIWYRIIQMITGFGRDQNQALQQYAANKLFAALSVPNVHENLVKIGSYVLAEYGRFIAEQPGKDPYKIFETLNKHWTNCGPTAKAMLLTAYVKLANQYPELKFEIISIFEINSQHWDPDIQQRALEYLNLLKDDSISEIRNIALEKMPPYSEEIQNNNPLLKKIFALKKGVTASKDPTLMNTVNKLVEEEMYKSQSMMSDSRITQKLSTIGKETVHLSNMDLTHSTTVTKPKPTTTLETDLLGGDDLLGVGSTTTTSKDLKSHPLYSQCEGKIATSGNIVPIPPKLQLPPGNAQEIKTLLTQPNGVIYQDDNITINYKSDFSNPPIGKIAMQFVSRGLGLSKLNLTIPNSNTLFFKMDPIQYGEHPNVIIQCLNTGLTTEFPKCNLTFTQGDSYKSIDFGLPIQSNKWIQSVDMPVEAFHKYYDEYTNANNDKYYRIDDFIKNPAGPNIPLTDVMKKFGALISNGLNFKVISLPSNTNIQTLCCVGQYVFRSEGAQNNTNLPLMIQLQCFENDKSSIRLSLRGAACKDILKNLYQLITLYVQ